MQAARQDMPARPHPTETIVAISTPPGRGGIGIVRLSGPAAGEIAAPMLRLRSALAHAQARFAAILDPGTQEKLDEAVVTYFAAPHSYTGEDVVEIAAHGSPVILEAVVRNALAAGARLAEPGEFTQRAFLSGRIDLTQAEAVRDLIDAQTLYQARVAAQQMEGALSRRIRPVKQQLVDLIVLLEAGIDFAEDDIEVTAKAEILDRLEAVRSALQPVADSFLHGRIVHAGLTLAIVGRANAGKSSLFNRVVERERAIVTAAPGTTRDLVTERLSLGGIPVELIDTAGLRETHDEAERMGIRKSREALADADIVLLVLDATEPLAEEERELLAALEQRQAIVIVNKIDLPAAPLSTLPGLPVVRTSALSGEGIAELKARMLALVRGGQGEAESGMLTNMRQSQAVAAALASLAAAYGAVEQNIPHEMVLLDLYEALRALDSLTGETTADDILNQIFASFCIGK
ncbi:MAG TPA: tRNA uridine-5-carboxymethylaminomethyl(34) synthesis GTPase MnmE [Acidobacteriaceae bacterium]|nr:tRNA uridine-5-carboxymethylaminomethyl(34) synthesis GTPase MnmE [Acidobacteriaceae bacterium]